MNKTLIKIIRFPFALLLVSRVDFWNVESFEDGKRVIKPLGASWREWLWPKDDDPIFSEICAVIGCEKKRKRWTIFCKEHDSKSHTYSYGELMKK